MDYLRRLHPAHADHLSAARLDAPAALAARAPAAFEQAAIPSLTTAAEAAAATLEQAPLRTVQCPPTEPSPRATPLAEVAASRALPKDRSSAPPDTPAARTSNSAARGSVLPSRQPRQATPSLVDAGPIEATLLLHAEAQPSPAMRRAEPSAVAVALQPLRPDAMRERDRTAADEPAPIIHVTINRIDVRVPSTATSPPAPGRRRAAPAVGALGDYLRGRLPEGRA